MSFPKEFNQANTQTLKSEDKITKYKIFKTMDLISTLIIISFFSTNYNMT